MSTASLVVDSRLIFLLSLIFLSVLQRELHLAAEWVQACDRLGCGLGNGPLHLRLWAFVGSFWQQGTA